MNPTPDAPTVQVNRFLMEKIPPSAKTILEIGCGMGLLGALVKARDPEVVYYGVESDLGAAQVAVTKLDRVFHAKIESDTPRLHGLTFDCIVMDGVLERVHDPVAVLSKVRPWLKPGGHILCCVFNIQHHSVFESLMNGDFQYGGPGLMSRTHLRFFTYASLFKLMLDAGFVGKIASVLVQQTPAPDEAFMELLKRGIGHLGNNPNRCDMYLQANQYIFEGVLNPTYSETLPPAFPISFVVPVNKRRILNDYLLRSPIFQGDHPHQIILLENQPSWWAAIQKGIQEAVHDFVVYIHQDIYLPRYFDAIFCHKVLQAEALFGNVGVVGIYGVNYRQGKAVHAGFVSSQHYSIRAGDHFPVQVEALDEGLMGFRKSVGMPQLNPAYGWHMYGTEAVCAYREMGKCAVVVDAVLYHNSTLAGAVPQAFTDAAALFAQSKWRKYFPVATHTAIFPAEGAHYVSTTEYIVVQDTLAWRT